MALILLKDSKARAREPPGKPLIEPKELFLNIKKVIQPTARNITGLIEPGTLAIRKYPLKARKKRIDSSGSIKNAEIQINDIYSNEYENVILRKIKR